MANGRSSDDGTSPPTFRPVPFNSDIGGGCSSWQPAGGTPDAAAAVTRDV